MISSPQKIEPFENERGAAASAPGRSRLAVRALRAHQWSKNLLLFVPSLTSHHLFNLFLDLRLLVGFVAYSLMASSVYVVNDIIDVPKDRAHPEKKNRPFASGQLPLSYGWRLGPFLGAAGLFLSAFIGLPFFLLLVVYSLLTLLYSLRLKSLPVVDVFCLAGFYSMRLLGGHLITHIPISFWLLTFTLFMFLSLALVKRVAELGEASDQAALAKNGRRYHKEDREFLRSLGVGFGLIAVLVFCLYLKSNDVQALYRSPMMLWLAVPVLAYWVVRLWFVVERGQLTGDPVVFALRDGESYAAGAIIFAIIVAASRVTL